MGKIKVRNATGIDVKIQEGNGGVFVTKSVVKNGASYSLKLDPNATYREYVLIRLPDNTALDPVFSSDDVADYKEILIKKDNGEYCWEGLYGKAQPTGTAPAPGTTPAPAPGTTPAPAPASSPPPPGILFKIKKFFGFQG